MTRQDREAAIADNIDYVDRVVAATRTAAEPLVFAGFSQGVAMAFRAAVRGKRRAAESSRSAATCRRSCWPTRR